VALAIIRRPKTTPVHELERYMRCKDRSKLRGYPHERSYLAALRGTRISASDPPSVWWPGERVGEGHVMKELTGKAAFVTGERVGLALPLATHLQKRA
jgi:hypothetical protein